MRWKYLIYIFAADMGIYRLIILFLLGALTLQVEAQDEFVPIDGEPRIKVVFYKKVQKEFYQGDSITVIIMPELPVYQIGL